MSLARHARHNATAVLLNAFSALAMSIVAARTLGPIAMGTYSWLTWLLALGAIVVHLGGLTTTTKHLAEAAGRGDLPEACGVLVHGLTRWARHLAWGLGAWALVGALLPLPVSHTTWLLTALVLLPSTLAMGLTGACQGLHLHRAVATAAALALATQGVGLSLVVWAGLGVDGIILTQGVAQALACWPLGLALAAWRPGWWRERPSQALHATLTRFGRTLALIVVVDAIVWQRSGVLVLERWSSAAEVGYYALAFSLAQMAMRTGPGALVGVLLPAMARTRGAGHEADLARLYRRTGRVLALVALPLGTIGATVAQPLVTLLFGPAYGPMAAPLALLLLGGAASAVLGFPASSLLYALDRPAAVQRTGLAGAAVYGLGVALLVPGGGALEAAIATVGAQATCLVLGTWRVRSSPAGCWPDGERLGWIALAAVAAGAAAAGPAVALPPGTGLAAGTVLGGLTYLLVLVATPALGAQARDALRAAARLRRRPRVTPVTTPGPLDG
ncbi:MAG: oligosaccharide flippase family protein [Candidatus Sericytochromatia bacterium]|nr:oligosaccharide flippase family protein [Candidatus Sericytochromatia bacterium]